MAGMKVLVTGSSGFIGGHLAAGLAKQGHDVFCLLRRTSVSPGLEGLKINRVLGDTRDKLSLDEAVKGTRKSINAALAGLRPEELGAIGIAMVALKRALSVNDKDRH